MNINTHLRASVAVWRRVPAIRYFIKASAAIVVVWVLLSWLWSAYLNAPNSAATYTPAARSAPEPVAVVTPPAAPETDFHSMFYYAKKEVESHLKSPRSAKFDRLDQAQVAPFGYHQWIVSGVVDAQNSFGVMLRHKWACLMVGSGESWQADYSEIGDEKFGEMPVARAWPLTAKQIAAKEAAAEAAKVALLDKRKAGQMAALKMNQAAADRGDELGLLRMGERYRDGEGVARDLAKAKEYLTRAAKIGNSDAKLALAKLPVQ